MRIEMVIVLTHCQAHKNWAFSIPIPHPTVRMVRMVRGWQVGCVGTELKSSLNWTPICGK